MNQPHKHAHGANNKQSNKPIQQNSHVQNEQTNCNKQSNKPIQQNSHVQNEQTNCTKQSSKSIHQNAQTTLPTTSTPQQTLEKTTTHKNHIDATRKNNNMLTVTVNANPSKRNQNACAQFCTTPTHNQCLLFNDGRSPSTNSEEIRLRGASAPMRCTGVEGSPTRRR